MTAAFRELRPHDGPQTEFLACPAFEAGFGGAAGPGKTLALLMDAVRFVSHSDYRAILFRRTFPELESSLIDRSSKYFPGMGATYNEQKKTWVFPSGAKIIFGHLQHESDVTDHLSAEYQFIGFDEGVTFTLKQFTFLISRLRSSSGIPCFIRWASNPADDDKHWLIARYAPWIDTRPGYKGPRAKDGEVLWFTVDGEGNEHLAAAGAPGALSRSYFPALLPDNPTLMKADPGYADRIRRMGAAEAKRFLDGDWFARDVKGSLFEKSDFDAHRVEPKGVPELVTVAVGVDPAVSNTESSDEHGIIAAGVSANRHVYVSEDWSKKGTPAEWATAVVRCVKQSKANEVVAEVNQGGDLVESNVHSVDGSIRVVKIHASRGKDVRAEPIATLAKQGRIHIVGSLPELESECTRWKPGVSKWSPNRMDAFVHVVRHLMPYGVFDSDNDKPMNPTTEDKIERALIERHEQSREHREWTG